MRTTATVKSLKRQATLARWLGPWASPERVPEGVDVRPWKEGEIASAPRGLHYRPASGAPCGAYLLAPGLHHEGIDDPRIDRVCRIFASAGFAVLSVDLEDMRSLRVTTKSIEQFGAALEWLSAWALDRRLPRPALFSISFGCMPAVRVAADSRWRDRIGAVVTFGGYCDFERTVRFALTGRTESEGKTIELPSDPLNDPAVFINLFEHLDCDGDPMQLRRAWLEMARRTWGRPQLRSESARRPIAAEIGAELTKEQRQLFLVGCGLKPGGRAMFDEAMNRARPSFSFAELAEPASLIRAPFTAIHGRDDDVIPWPEATRLHRAASAGGRAKRLVTGAFSHTESAIPPWRRAGDEIRCMLNIIETLGNAPVLDLLE